MRWNDAEILAESMELKKLIRSFIKTSNSSRLDIPTEKKSIKDFALLLETAERESLFSENRLTALRNLMDIPKKTENVVLPHIGLTIEEF